jgi:hypothetical protein
MLPPARILILGGGKHKFSGFSKEVIKFKAKQNGAIKNDISESFYHNLILFGEEGDKNEK